MSAMQSADGLPRTRYGNPVLRCTHDVLRYWIERSYATAPEYESFSKSSMICRGDSVFHYGTHFELARILRDRRGRTRLILLNGDTWAGTGGFGPSTSSRQRETRGVVAETDWPSIVVPFSALEGAGIDFDSIHPIHVRDERWTNEEHSSRKQPTKELSVMEDPSGATRTVTRWVYDHETKRQVEREIEEPRYVDDPNRTRGFWFGHGRSEGAERGEDGVWRWTVRRHWLGDSLFRARLTERRTRKATSEELAHHRARLAYERECSRLEEIENQWWRKARQVEGRSWSHYGVSEFDGDYRRMTRSMFAAEGFRAKAMQAREAAEGYRYAHSVAASNVRGDRMPITVTRWATYLSSFDYQETPALYFLCELPYGAKPNTVDEAIEALKPPEVVAALARGLGVIRQGDLFAIPTKLTKRQIRRMRGREDFTKGLRVLGTNHSVTEGIVLKGGAVLGRGIMRHEPESWRPPDHKRVKLADGETWHLLVRNTVPRTR